MRLLIVNPNINAATNARIRAVAGPLTSTGDVLAVVSAPSGIELIETPEQSQAVVPAVLATVKARHREADAIVIAAFSDPGLAQARGLAACPVLGISESAMRVAARRAARFSIVTLGEGLRDAIRGNAVAYGFGDRLASIRILPSTVQQVADEPLAYRAAFVTACERAVADDGAGAVIIGGGPLSGIADAVSAELHVPVLDGVRCAVELALRGEGAGSGCGTAVGGDGPSR